MILSLTKKHGGAHGGAQKKKNGTQQKKFGAKKKLRVLDVCCDLTPSETSRWLELKPDRENVTRSGTGSIIYGTNAMPD